jgi:hypothetical protein
MENTREIKASLSVTVLLILFLSLSTGLYILTQDLSLVAQALAWCYVIMAACLSLFLTLANARDSQTYINDRDQNLSLWVALLGIVPLIVASFVYLGFQGQILLYLGIASFFLSPWMTPRHTKILQVQAISGSSAFVVTLLLALFFSGLELATLGLVTYQSLHTLLSLRFQKTSHLEA